MGEPSSGQTILVVDDSPESLEIIRRNLSAEGYRVFVASSVADGVTLMEKTSVDLVITDLKMPGVGGIDLVRHVRENLNDTEIMIVTGYPSVDSAVTAVKAGAEEYLVKPFTEEELRGAVRRSLTKLALRRAARPESPGRPSSRFGLIGSCAAMKRVYDVIEKAAGTPATALITGESGTGKELVARAIHYTGPRASAPFVPVNCGAIPEGLIESELFGHLKGAFTGASESRAGFFLAADGGTIFLDEISEIGPAMQVKLLRVLQDREIYMVGATRPRKVDVRVLAATNKPLATLVEKQAFREDLYFRINVLVIEIPPLREREDDVLLLANHFVAKFARELGKLTPKFSEAALEALRHYHWPGNIRELENLAQRLVVMLDSPLIEVSDLPATLRFSAGRGFGIQRTLAEVEAEHIRNVLSSVQGNKTRAAEILGIDRKTLRDKMKPRILPSA